MQVPGRGLEYKVVHLILPHDAGLTDFIESNLSILPERVSELLKLGAIYINDRRAKYSVAEGKLPKGARIRVHTEPRRYYHGKLLSRIVESTPDYYIVDKPGGLPSHALVDNQIENVIELLSLELNEKLYITHRLDIGTSGMLIIARNVSAQAKVNELIKLRKIKKFYSALTESPVELGTHIHFMEPTASAPKNLRATEKMGWQRCELIVLSCVQVKDGFKSEIELVTGRSQQIRAQLGFMGSPIIGDVAYGSKSSYFDTFTKEKAIALRAESIQGLKF